PFGLSNIRQDQSGFGGMVANAVMSPAIDLFKPLQSSYFDQAALMQGKNPEFLQYVFWKTEQRPAYVPELSEVREEVLDFWKRKQARELAAQEAQALAAKVETSPDATWDQALSAAQQALLVQTDPFSWMTRFSNQPMVSN